MDYINPDSGVALTGVNAADGDKIAIKDVSAVVSGSTTSANDSGLREMTLAELSIALNRETVYTADGAIAITPGTVMLEKTSAAAMTLAAPTAAQEGTTLVIIAGTAFAHVITATNLLDDGVTGGAKDTATFGAFVGAALTLRATNLRWAVVSKNVCTIAAV